MRKWLNKIVGCVGMDGLLHILASTAIVLMLNVVLPWWCSVVIAAIIGVGKELIWDFWHQGENVQVKDLICDAIGILLGCLAFV